MILLTDLGKKVRPPCTIAVFGVGLLGSAIVKATTSIAPLHVARIPLSWTDAALQAQQLLAIEANIAAALQESLAQARHGKVNRSVSLKVLWSAGQAGFTATEAETAGELGSFQVVLSMTERLARQFSNVQVVFYLLSSAGGLFEGQRRVDSTSSPQPRRPYGLLKKGQEDLLTASDAPITKRIYRLTSVYGYLRPYHRIGLISALILNGVRHQVSHITATMSTLRDFIFVEDVAQFLSRLLFEDNGEQEQPAAVFAHARPFSLFEIQRLVESALGRKVYVSYSLDPSNREDITFSRAVLPSGWQSSDLKSNIGRVYKEAIASGAVFKHPLTS